MPPTASTTELIRAASLTAFPETARSFGLKPESLLSEVGIDRRALDDPEMRISAPVFGRLLELAARQSKAEAFGLHMAETRSIVILGPIGLLLREEPTVRHALRSLAKYLFLHNEVLALHLDEVEDQAVVSLEIHLARQMPFRQGVELSIAVLYRILQSLIGPTWQPIVCLSHEPPARRDVHHRVLGLRVDFRCNYNGMIFPARDLDRPLPGASPIFAEHARRYLESMANRTGATLEAKVRELVRAQLSSGRCTVDRLAHQIGCDRRTLHRRLALEQVTFDAILHSVRGELAVRLLQNRRANLASTADMLGFSSTSAFSRWFLDRFGTRPSEWRKQSLHSG
ncbi:MAG: AraC family transcriptional regulator [Proteobacteria bacterium]|nr:AraC family transcriptional regulator [Pseudomonadota bacterium]